MPGNGAWGKLSVLVSLVAGVILVFVIFFEDRPDEKMEPRQTQSEPAPPQAPPPPEPSEKVALAAVTLPPPPAPPAPQKPEETVKPMQPKEKAAEPAQTVKPLEPATKPEKIVAKPMVLKPLEKKAETPPVPMKLTPRKPQKAAKVIEKAPAVEPPKRLEPMRPVAVEKVVEPAKPEPLPEKPDTVHVSVRSDGSVAKEGRALLRLLEHGSGPTIEISWPTGSSSRRSLYRALSGCFGMQAILMDGAGNLYAATGERGRKWEINLDRYSGFVRQPAGFIASEERASAEAIRRYHGFGRNQGVVRVFPRQVDSVLLGGLQQVLGENYRHTKRIRASYRQDGRTLYVEGIEADGMRVDGRIAFNPKRGSGCRI